MFYLVYNFDLMEQHGYWKRRRGLANSKGLEQALVVYKGGLPKTMPKTRMYVDAGSPLFNQIMKDVPVLAPKHHACVSMTVREQSLSTMHGFLHRDDEIEQEQMMRSRDEDDAMGLNQPGGELNPSGKDRVAAHTKQRKLDRQLVGETVQWFSHDNDMELLKELC